MQISDKSDSALREELYIMQILNQVVYLDKPIPMSSLKSTFTTLVDYMSLIQNPLEKATKILRAVAWYVYYIRDMIFCCLFNIIWNGMDSVQPNKNCC